MKFFSDGKQRKVQTLLSKRQGIIQEVQERPDVSSKVKKLYYYAMIKPLLGRH